MDCQKDKTSISLKEKLIAIEHLSQNDQQEKLPSFWRYIQDEYKPKARLGKGAFGQVIKAKHRVSKKTVAIKCIKIEENPLIYQKLIREVAILRQLSDMEGNHYCTQLLDIVQPANTPYLFLVLDYFPLTLFQLLEKSSSLDFKEADVKKLLFNLLRCLAFLHSAGLMHRDIKPANILVDADLNVKLCDFGFTRSAPPKEEVQPADNLDSKKRTQPKRRLTQHVCTRYYRPPEVILLEKQYDSAVDLWSSGCILSELITSQVDYKEFQISSSERVLFRGQACHPLSPAVKDGETTISRQDQLKKILKILGRQGGEDTSFVTLNQEYLERVQPNLEKVNFADEFMHTSRGLISILEDLLSFNPNSRSSASTLLAHPYFADLHQAGSLPRASTVHLRVDELADFDYYKQQFEKTTLDDLKDLLEEEVRSVSAKL